MKNKVDRIGRIEFEEGFLTDAVIFENDNLSM